jgi:DNA-binding response OmpR family regulator
LAAYKNVPVFMLTAEGQDAIIAEGKEAGVSTWMVKLFFTAQLVKAVAILCR